MALSGIWLRTWHANISAFIAPMVFFYALSGALQIFGLHQSHGAYHAPALLSAIGRLHKDQVFAAAAPHRPPPGAFVPGEKPGGAAQLGPPPEKPIGPATLALKWLFFVEALGLAGTTGLGVWIGLTHAKRKKTIVALLGAGTALPLVLVVLGATT